MDSLGEAAITIWEETAPLSSVTCQENMTLDGAAAPGTLSAARTDRHFKHFST